MLIMVIIIDHFIIIINYLLITIFKEFFYIYKYMNLLIYISK